MKLSTWVSLLASAGLCYADLSPATESYKKGPDEGRKNHLVTVAKVAHEFYPTEINATIGDTITFQFYPQTHSVVLADYQAPCVPWSQMNIGQKDTWSGLITEKEHRVNPQEWTMRVTTAAPQFFYCSGPESCNKWGMVFSVNANEQQNWKDFHERATTRHYQVSPGEAPPPEGEDPKADDETKEEGGSKKLSTGAIVGIVIGGVAAIGIIAMLFYLFGRLKTQKNKEAAAERLSLNPDTMNGAATSALPPPPMYEHHPNSAVAPEMQNGYYPPYDPNTKTPILIPGSPVPTQYDPRMSTYMGSPNPSLQPGPQAHQGHMSWASELGVTPIQEIAPVEIYTPGQDVQAK